MILASKQNTGYSLGAPLWWLTDPQQYVVSGIQGISITLRGPMRSVYLSKYIRTANALSLTFSTESEILCELETALSRGTATYPLRGVSDKFVSGWVTLCATDLTGEATLSAALVCPRYVHVVADDASTGIYLNIVGQRPVAMADLEFSESGSVSLTIEADTIFRFESVSTTIDTVSIDGVHVYSINGIPPDENGVCSINMSDAKWVIAGSGVCVKIGLNTDVYSCDSENYIEATLNPRMYPTDYPLSLAFTDNTLDMNNVYTHTFNMYDNDGLGLRWDQLSPLHDVIQSE